MEKIKKMSREEIREAIENEPEISGRFKEYTSQQQTGFIEIIVLIADSFETYEDFKICFQRYINEKNHNAVSLAGTHK